MSSLGSSKSKLIDQRVQSYIEATQQCPPVSKALIAHLDKMFSAKSIPPTSPSMQQELVFQAGIEKVKDYLKDQNARQERDIKEIHT